jgi:hypothetical protein
MLSELSRCLVDYTLIKLGVARAYYNGMALDWLRVRQASQLVYRIRFEFSTGSSSLANSYLFFDSIATGFSCSRFYYYSCMSWTITGEILDWELAECAVVGLGGGFVWG